MSETAQNLPAELAPIKVERVNLPDGRVLVARKPLMLNVIFHADEEFFVIDYEPLHLILWDDTYDDLEIFIYKHLAHIWIDVVENAKVLLPEHTKDLRENYKKHFEVQ